MNKKSVILSLSKDQPPAMAAFTVDFLQAKMTLKNMANSFVFRDGERHLGLILRQAQDEGFWEQEASR